MKFPYRKVNLKHPFTSKQFILRPIIPVSLKNGNKSVRYEALIDSGADFNIFPIEIAERLGIKLKNEKKIYFSGIEGNMMEGVTDKISLRIGGKIIFTKAVFAAVGNGVLGQYGFFDLCLVQFDLKKKNIGLV